MSGTALEPVLLVGAGGLARETVEAMRAGNVFTPAGYLDDNPAAAGTRRLGVPVLGPVASAGEYDRRLVICPGKGATRLAVEQMLAGLGVAADRYVTVVHPSAAVASSAVIGPGSVLLAGVVLTAEVTLGRHVVAMPNTVLTHDDVLEDGATLCAGVALGGSVRVGRAAYLGARAVIRENLEIGAGAVVGQGAVVLRDVPAGETWVGNPARPMASVA